jgi:hypothetical protein
MDQYVEFVEVCAWKILPFVDKNGGWLCNCSLGIKQFGLVTQCLSDVWLGLPATYVDYYAFSHQICPTLECFHVWFHYHSFLL